MRVISSHFVQADVDICLAMAHSDYQRRDVKEPYIADPRDIAVCAEQLARLWCGVPNGRKSGVTTRFEVVNLTYAGLCAYAVDHYGFTYTQLCQICHKAVADHVVAISGDARLPIGRYHEDLANRLGIVGTEYMKNTQIESLLVRLAEIYASLIMVRNDLAADQERIIEERESIHAWIQRTSPMVDAIKHRFQGDKRFAAAFAKTDAVMMSIYLTTQRQRRRGEIDRRIAVNEVTHAQDLTLDVCDPLFVPASCWLAGATA